MYRRRCQWLCMFLILLIGVSGLCPNENISTGDMRQKEVAGQVLYLTAGDTFAADETACTTEMLGIKSSTELARMPVLSDELRREARVVFLGSYHSTIPLNNQVAYMKLRSTKHSGWNQGGQVVNYIHKSDGKKEPDISYIQTI